MTLSPSMKAYTGRWSAPPALRSVLLWLSLAAWGAVAPRVEASPTVGNAPECVDEGSSGSFTLTVTHPPAEVDSVCTVMLTVDAAFSAIAAPPAPAGWTAEVTGNVITWSADSLAFCLPPDSQTDFAWSALAPTVGGTYPCAWSIGGGLDSGSFDICIYSPSFTTSTKSAIDVNGGDLRPGDTIAYQIDVVNTGDMEASGVIVTDTLATSTASVNSISNSGVYAAGPPKRITWNLGAIASGATQSLSWNAVIATPLDNGTSVTNRAAVRSDQTPSVLTNQTSFSIASAPVLGASSKAVTDIDGHNVSPGDSLRYVLSIRNTGDMNATSVVVRDTLDTDIASVTGITGSGSLAAGPPKVITWNVGTLNAGATASRQFDGELSFPLDHGTTVLNRAAVTSGQTSSVLTNQLTSTVVAAPLFTASTKSASDLSGAPLRPGDTVAYSLTIRNTGDMNATGVTVLDTLATQFTGASAISGGGTYDAGPPATIAWSLGNIAAGAQQVLTYNATLDTPIDHGTAITNRAGVASDQTGSVLTSTSSLSITSAPSFSTDSKGWEDINGGLLQAGDIIEYTLTIPNTGDMNATGVVVTDVFPAHLTYAAGTTTLNGAAVPDVSGASPLVAGMATNSPGEAAGVIVSGESAEITVRLTVDDDVVDGQTFTNSFTETSAQGVSGGASVTSTGVDIGVPSLTSSPDADVNTCDLISYELRLIPDEAVAWDVYLETELPDGFSYQTGSALVRNSGTGATSSADPVVSGGTIRWNHDGANPNPGNAALWDVAPSDTLVITFDLRAETCVVGDQLVTTTEYHKPGAGANYAPSSAQVATTYNLLEGALTVEKSPIAPAAAVGDTIQYTLTIESVGFGSVSQVVLTDSLLAGIRLVPGLTSPSPSSIEMHADSTTLLTWDASTPGLDRLQPGDDFVINLAVRLIDCRNYDDIFTARWGCADQLCETRSTVASVNLLLAEPELELSLSPSPITVTACDTAGTLVTLTIANAGGEMRNTVLDLVGFPGTLELDSVTGADWSAGDPFTFDVGTVAAQDTVALQFRVRHVDNCSPGSGAIVFLPSYTNVCGDPYNYTSLVSSVATTGLPSLSVTQDSVVEIDQGAIQPWGFTLCSTLIPPQNPVTVTATHSGAFTFQGDESPPASSGGGLGDALTTWVFAPGDFDVNGCIEVDWTLAASGSCGTTGTVTVSASTTTDCGSSSCNASASASALAAIDCDTETTNCVPLMTHVVNDSLSTTESVCDPMTHEVEVHFDDGADVSFSELTFKAEAEGGKSLVGHRLENGEYVYNVARFTYTDSSGVSCSLDLEPIRDGNNELSWDLSPLDELSLKPGCDFAAPPLLAGGRLHIAYDLQSEVDLAYHFEFARLVVSGSASCDGTYNEPVQVTIGHSTMGASLTLPTMIDKCVPTLLNLTVSKSGQWPTYDNVLYLATDQFELIDDPDDPDFALPHFVGLPNLGLPTRVDDIGNGSPGVMWKLGDLDANFASGTITLPTRLSCDGEDAVARVVYDDLCGDDDTDNINENSYAAVATTSPVLVRSANVSLQFTPETYFAEGDSALWTLFVINGGTGAAPNVTLTSTTPGTGLAFAGYRLYDGAGVERPEALTVDYGPGSRSATFVVDEIPAGETWQVRVSAAVTGCDDLLHAVSGFWGCEGDSCQSGGSLIKQAAVELPPVLVISDLSAGGTATSCEERAVTLTIKNASAARAQGSVVRVRLPEGLSYIDDTSTISISHPGGATAPVVLTPGGSGADPELVTDELVWTLSEHLSTSYLSPQDIVTLTFSLLVDAGFEEGIVFSSGTYSDGCNRTLDMTSDRSTFASERIDVDAFAFSLDVDSLQACSQYGLDDTRLTYAIENPLGNGDAFGPVELSLRLPAGVAYVQGTTAIAFPTVTGSATHRTEPSITGTGIDSNPYVLHWTLGSNTLIEAGESIIVVFDARHQGSFGCALPEQTTELGLTGQRCAAGNAGGGTFTTQSEAIPFHFQEPDLGFRLELFDRTANGATAPGDTVEVLAILENAGSGSARSPSLEVVLDADGLSYLSSTPPRDGSTGATSTWDSTLGSIAAGEIDTVLVLAVVQQGVDLGEVLQVDGSLTEGCCDQLVSDRALLVTSGQAHLDLEKSATQAVVVPGGTVTYQLLIHNDGSQAFRNVVIDETAPLPGLTYFESEYDTDHVTFSGTANAPQWTIAASDSAQAPFSGGATEIIRVSYTIAEDYSTIGTPPGSGRVDNTASIASLENLSGASLSDAELLDSDTESLPVQVSEAAVDLSKIAVQGVAEPGELVTYLLRVTNHGGQSLQDLVVTDLPAVGLTFVSSQYPDEVTETDTSPPTYALTSLPELLTREIAVTFRVDSDTTVTGSSLTNLATVTARDEADVAIPPDSASVTLPVIPAASALDLAKVATRGDIVPGESITYQLVVTNPGATDLTDVVVVDTPPSGLTLTAVEHDDDVLQTSGAPPTFSIASLPAGAAEVISLSFAASADTSLLSDPVVNSASASGTDPSGAAIAADPATSSLPLSPRVTGLRIQKISTESEVVPGSTLSYILVVSNPGDEVLTNVDVVDEPPPGFSYLDASYDPERVSELLDAPPTFRVGTLEPGGLELITIRFRASADPDSLSDPVVNLALAEAIGASGQSVAADTSWASLPISDLRAALDLEKTAAQAVVVPGGTVTYELLLQNTGTRTLRDIVVAESATLSGLTFLESSFDSNLVSWTGSSSAPEWTISDPSDGHPEFAPAGSTVIRVSYTAADDYTLVGTPAGSGRVDNVVTVTAAESREGTPLSDPSVLVSDTESLPVQVPVAALDLQKVAIHGVAVPGEYVTYLVRVTNRGNQDLHDITVVDIPPAGLVLQSSQFDGAVTEDDTDPPTYSIADLPILGSEEIALSFLVGDDLTILGDSLINVASASGLDAGGTSIAADTARVTIAVSTPLSDLDLSKIATTSVVTPGSTVSYLLIAENRGDTDLSNVTLTDTPPPGFTYLHADHDADVTQTDTDPPTFVIPSLPAGNQELVTLVFAVDPDTTALNDPSVNQATLTGLDPSGDPVTADPASSSLPIATRSSALRVNKTATESFVQPGEPITYLLTVTNPGEEPLTDIEVTDLVPEGLVFAYAQYDAGRVSELASDPPTYRIASLGSHDWEQIGLTFEVTDDPDSLSDPVVNRAVGSGVGASGQSVVSDTTSCSVPRTGSPHGVDIEKSCLTTELVAGELADYLLQITNRGESVLHSVTVSDILPSDLSYVASEPTPIEAPAGTLTWELADLAPGESHQITLRALVDFDPSSTITNTAGVTALTPGNVSVTDSDQVTSAASPGASSLHLEKSPTAGHLTLGGQVTYLLEVSNDGDQPLSSVSLVDSLPAGTVYAGSDHDPARWNLISVAPIVRWDLIGELLPGQSEEVALYVDGGDDFSDFGLSGGDTTLVNVATVTADDPQGGTLSDLDTGVVQLASPLGAVLLNKVCTLGEIVPGEDVLYVLTAENIGDQDLYPFEL
ncbi:MAG: DUF11 domain-containing protein, partial [Candidatus Eisenbacteria bacterium]|nr:DUF11 domain-containing protein [Candidatus Eisenbacteria bacterium]